MKVEYSVNGGDREELLIIEYGINGELLFSAEGLALKAARYNFRFISAKDFPINIEIFIDGKSEGIFKVEMEYKPIFTASKIE